VLVGLCGSQGCGRIQLHQIIFEHAFNIRGKADTPPAISTRRKQRTTPHAFRQHW
jgi:hypothetical protein